MTGKAAAAAAAAALRKGRPRTKQMGRPPRLPDPPRRDLRPRHRRRFVHDDYSDDDEDEKGRRKLRLVLKLPHIPTRTPERCPDSSAPSYCSAASSDSYVDDADEDDEEEASKPLKKRRLSGGLGSAGSGHREEKKENGVRRSLQPASGVPSTSPSTPKTPLPDRKTLEEILDKLQKKDTYGAYAQPVDPEELPDYHDVIEHPMDFGTVRKKLAKSAYSSFEQFEDDVFLICSNAMQYNAPSTIYFRQARAMQELAKKKFQNLRADCGNDVVEREAEEEIKNSSMTKMPDSTKKSSCLSSHEPVASDISSVATLASAPIISTVFDTTQASAVERPVNIDGSAEGSSSLGECKSDKVDDISAKCTPSELGRKPFYVDENRRATYVTSDQQSFDECDSVLDIFKGEKQQLDAVGVDSEYSYARSLARFAGPLGPIAWRIASERIKNALPSGVKFGPGWVGEFEPLPTPILSFENHTRQKVENISNLNCSVSPRRDKRNREVSKSRRHSDYRARHIEQKSHMIATSSIRASDPMEASTTEAKKGLFVSTQNGADILNIKQQLPREQVVDFVKPYKDSTEKVRPCNLSSANCIPFGTALQGPEFSSEIATSGQPEMILINKNTELSESPRWRDAMNSRSRNYQQPDSVRQPELVVSQGGNDTLRKDGGGFRDVKITGGNDTLRKDGRGFREGKITGKSEDKKTNVPLDFISEHKPQVANYFTSVPRQSNIIDNPFRLISSSGKISNQSHNFGIDTNSPKQAAVPQLKREDLSAAATAARAWMSVGPTTESKSIGGKDLFNKQVGSASVFNNSFPKTMTPPFKFLENSNIRPVAQVYPQPTQVVNEEPRFQDRGLVIFPQLVGIDLSKFQGQSPLQGIVQHPKHRQDRDMLPPDLNIAFQPVGSPVRPSSGTRMDSQQPDLALQL